MGLDGFSMGNLGLNLSMTSATMAERSEQLAQKDSEIKIKDVTELASDNEVKRKEERSEEDQPKNKNREDNTKNENKNEISNILSEKGLENINPREFSIRINIETDMVELFNNKEGRVLETIDAEELMEIMSKLSHASGILVNRKI